MNFKAYRYIAKMRIQTMMAYRVDTWTFMIMQCLMMVAVAFSGVPFTEIQMHPTASQAI